MLPRLSSEGRVKKLRQCLKTTIIFVPIPCRIAAFRIFLNLGQDFQKVNPFVFMRGF